MSASEEQRAEWLGSHFWDPFDRLDNHHPPVQSNHEVASRNPDGVSSGEVEDLLLAWRGYYAAIALLE